MYTVSNASPLIALARIDCWRVLRPIFNQIRIPSAVWDEIVVRGAGKAAAELTLEARQSGWLEVLSVQDLLAVNTLRATLGPGEAEAIVLAQEIGATWVLLDDGLARAHAMRANLRVKGTAGILLAANLAGLLPDLKSALDALRAKGFHLDDRIYRAVLAQGK